MCCLPVLSEWSEEKKKYFARLNQILSATNESL